MDLIEGLHHVTACVDGAQEDIDFYTKVIGHTLIKQTVLLDGDRAIYHLYYADPLGSPGTVMTSFPFRGRRYGRRGTGQIKATSYSVPSGALDFWTARLARMDVPHGEIAERFGRRYLRFSHPSEIEVEVLEEPSDGRTPWVAGDIGTDEAVRGIHSVTLTLRETADAADFLTEVGFRRVGEDGAFTRFEVGAGGPGRIIDLLHEPDVPAGTWTYAGKTYNHVAWNVPVETDQQVIKQHLDGWGFIDMSEIKDRNYFHSSYVRMPGGVLFELCTSVPESFAKDESPDRLGRELLLPPWKEDDRDGILAELEPISVGASAG
jgi:glyoxalase family protein